MGTLIVGNLDFNNAQVVNNFLNAVTILKNNKSLYYPLDFKPNFYFKILNNNITSDRGWYVILSDININTSGHQESFQSSQYNELFMNATSIKPIYVGQADNLNSRLNSNNGSLDNFANQGRQSDSERNIIKKMIEINILINTVVFIIPEIVLCKEMGIDPGTLLKTDRDNIEKLLNICRNILLP